MTLRFNDGVSFDTSGDYRIVRKHDGYYVVGHGTMTPVADREEGWQLIRELRDVR